MAMKNYNVLMRDKSGDEGWTQCEGSSEANAKVTVMLRYGKGWRVVECNEAQPFYQVTYVGTEEEEREKSQRKQESIAKLANLNKRVVITPAGEFPSVVEAAEHYKISSHGMRQRIKAHPTEYYYK